MSVSPVLGCAVAVWRVMGRGRVTAMLAVGAALWGCAALPPSMLGGDVRLASAAPTRLRYDAAGRSVILAAPEGLCLTPETHDSSRNMAMAIVEPCRGAPPLPSLRTVSLSGAPYGQGGLKDLERWARSRAALPSLSLTGGADGVRLISARRKDQALIVHLSEETAGIGPVGPARLCRVFAQIRERAVLVSVVALGEEGPEFSRLERAALRILDALRRANSTAVSQPTPDTDLPRAGAALPPPPMRPAPG